MKEWVKPLIDCANLVGKAIDSIVATPFANKDNFLQELKSIRGRLIETANNTLKRPLGIPENADVWLLGDIYNDLTKDLKEDK